MQNVDKLTKIKEICANHELDYKINDIFEDFGLKNLIKKVRYRIELLNLREPKSNSIIKIPF